MTQSEDDADIPLPPDDGAGDGEGRGQDAELVRRLRSQFRTVDALTAALRWLILELEDRASAQIDAIIEAAPFAGLEAAWRGVYTIVHAARSASAVKVKILDVSWDELSHDLHYQSDIRRSHLYTLMGTRELNTLGGEPFGIAMIEHAVSMSLDSEFDELYTAQLVSDLGAACSCPFVLGVADDFFGEVDAAWLTDTRRIGNILGAEEFSSWSRLRSWPNARFLGLVMPRVLLRSRYTDRDVGFRFHQWPRQSSGLWGNAAVAFLATVIAEYHRCAWFGFLKLVSDTPGMGAVLRPLPAPVPEGTETAPLTSIRLNRPLGLFYSEAGFIPLVESSKDDLLYFVGNRSVTDCAGHADKEVLSQLQSVLIACRLVHYIKVQMRRLIGQIKTADECELFLNNWLEVYVSNVAEAAPEILARYPLKNARVSVSDTAGDQGRFNCEILLKPQYQIDHMLGEIRLTTDLADSGQEAA